MASVPRKTKVKGIDKSGIRWKHLYSVKGIFTGRFVEADGKEAGFNLIKHERLLNSKLIEQLEKMTKFERTIRIGKLRAAKPEFSRIFADRMRATIAEFIEVNEIEDDEIISIRNDAVIYDMKYPLKKTVVNGVTFLIKNQYTSFLHINRLEVFFNSVTDEIEVKGISDKTVKLHESGMLLFLTRFLTLSENRAPYTTLKYLASFREKYLSKRLDVNYYREFNQESCFAFIERIDEHFLTENKEMKSQFPIGGVSNLNIEFNFFNIILPLILLTIET